MVRNKLRGGIIKGPRSGESMRKIKMGPETVSVGVKTYRQIHFGSLLVKILFGVCYEKFGEFEWRKYGKGGGKKKLFHVCSHDRMATLFCLNGWSGIDFDGDFGVRTCCGRVFVERRRNGKVLGQQGFIIAESPEEVQVKLENHELVWLQKPLWDRRKGYVLDNNICSSYTITQYDPVRLFFSPYGDLQMLFHRITFEQNSNNLIFE